MCVFRHRSLLSCSFSRVTGERERKGKKKGARFLKTSTKPSRPASEISEVVLTHCLCFLSYFRRRDEALLPVGARTTPSAVGLFHFFTLTCISLGRSRGCYLNSRSFLSSFLSFFAVDSFVLTASYNETPRYASTIGEVE